MASWIVFVSVESHDIMEVGQLGNKKSDSIKTIFPFLEAATLLLSQLNFPDFWKNISWWNVNFYKILHRTILVKGYFMRGSF